MGGLAALLRAKLPDLVSGSLQEPFLADIFHVLASSLLLESRIEMSTRRQLIASIRSAEAPIGFYPIATLTQTWQKKPRIYSTYYGLSALEIADALADFLNDKDEWQINTESWIRSCQAETGQQKGVFLEPDCPTSISPELCWWALSILRYLGTDTKGVMETLSAWLMDTYLVDWKNRWSATKIFYATKLLLESGRTTRENVVEELTAFLESLQRESGFIEFQPEVKSKFREEGDWVTVNPHSTAHGYLALRNLGVALPWSQISRIIDEFSKGGFTGRLRIKSYEYSTECSGAEILALLVLALACED
jgi:hypothetical protein